jgi:hypothetical protein
MGRTEMLSASARPCSIVLEWAESFDCPSPMAAQAAQSVSVSAEPEVAEEESDLAVDTGPSADAALQADPPSQDSCQWSPPST